MFAAGLTFERDPLRLGDLPPLVPVFIANAGLLVAILLALWLLISRFVLGIRRPFGDAGPALRTGFWLAVTIALVAYCVWIVGAILEKTSAGVGQHRRLLLRIGDNALIFGGLAAMVAVLLPMVANLIHLRWRRIWALARLSFKEALRRKVLWLFLILLVVILFGSWFIPYKSEDQLRTYVQVVSFSMWILLLMVAGLLAAFGIPTDMKQQTIHTILTKPVERFEVVLGRFLGYMVLLTLVLVVVSAVSLLYVLRGIDPDAAYESLKARETMYGDLEFEGTKDRNKATNVGKEWDYRTYIYGPEPQQPAQVAVWKFTDVKGLADRKKVRCEFTFDIYRTTKGRINEGVFCTFLVQTGDCDASQKQAYENERKQERQKPGADLDAIDERLAEKYGCYEVAGKEIRNLHTYYLDIPGGVYKHAAEHPVSKPASPLAPERPPIAIKVKCESRTQYVGVAKYDLYIRPDYDYGLSDEEAAQRDRLRFMRNYAKGQCGLWFSLCLVVGIAVSLSTYLSGLITFLTTAAIYMGGLSRDFIRSLAEGTTGITGGPFESAYRLGIRDLGAPLDETTTLKFVYYSDDVYRWVVRLFMNVLPDVDRFDLSSYVAEGFNIAGGQLLVTFVFLASYLLLAAIAGFYLMKGREIASSM
jgi:hypothetical protein